MKEALIAFGVGKKPAFEFVIPEGLSLKTEEGEETEVVAKVRKNGEKLELISVNGVALNPDSPADQEEEWEDEETYENEAAEEGQEEMESDSLGSRARAAGFM